MQLTKLRIRQVLNVSSPSVISQIQRGGRVALIDYGQSKQLPDALRLQFADLVLQLQVLCAVDLFMTGCS